MKKLLLIVLLLISSLLLAQTEKIDECKTDIYFGNGVWNSKKDAEHGRAKLQTYIIDREIIKNDPKLRLKYGEVKLQYNWSHGGMLDVLETFYQLKEAGQISEEWFFTFVDELMAKQVSDIADEDVKSLREQIINLIISTEENEVSRMVAKYYDESFKFSHRVLLISHSQGNLFANRVDEQINPTEYKNYFANLQVASPASEVKAQKGDYVTGFIDPVINPIPGSMEYNSILELPGGHALVEAYLSSPDPLTRITDKMKQLLISLDAEPSQWETDQELNKGTKDYKITVKHRFDSSVVMSEEVYPFAASKKLYHVIDNAGGNGWVKASCGGSEIFDYWIDKKENEFYFLKDTNEIISISRFNDGLYTAVISFKRVPIEVYNSVDDYIYFKPNYVEFKILYKFNDSVIDVYSFSINESYKIIDYWPPFKSIGKLNSQVLAEFSIIDGIVKNEYINTNINYYVDYAESFDYKIYYYKYTESLSSYSSLAFKQLEDYAIK